MALLPQVFADDVTAFLFVVRGGARRFVLLFCLFGRGARRFVLLSGVFNKIRGKILGD